MISGRRAIGLDDLRLAESVLSRAWLDGAPFAASHPGDLEWWHAQAAPDPLEAHLRLWDVDGDLRAWSWVRRDQVQWEMLPGDPTGDATLLEAILVAAIEEVDGTLHAWAPEDDEATVTTLRRLGFEPGQRRLSQFQRHVDDDSPILDAPLPAGYRIRPVVIPEELMARTEVHRRAFAPSRLTTAMYERLTTLPRYRPEDDLVIEAPDSSIAAFAMAWWDPVARIGEFEPVGTHPDHQRRGLGRALLAHGLRRYQDQGASLVQVYSQTDNEASEGLYEAVGFRRRRYRRLYERHAGPVVRSGA